MRDAAIAGVKWLLDLQNRDGGIPTFCRGWTNLPFDRSSPDITAHALRAWLAWKDEIPRPRVHMVNQPALRLTSFLRSSQQAGGTWVPLWFGNQHTKREENPVYGSAQVIKALGATVGCFPTELVEFKGTWDLKRGKARPNEAALAGCMGLGSPEEGPIDFYDWGAVLALQRNLDEGVRGLVNLQHADGSWGGASPGHGSCEETALAIEALASVCWPNLPLHSEVQAAVALGQDWLLRRIEDGTWTQPAPIGFYFAKLWYYERLYPMVFTVAALEAVARLEAADQ